MTAPASRRGRVARWRDDARELTARGRDWSLRMLDVVPGLRRLINDLARVEFIDRSMVVAAQALLSLLPLFVIIAAFMPDQLGSFAADRFVSVTGLGDLADTSLTPDQVQAQTGLAGLLITLFSATSFARAVQRMYERVWEKRHIGGVVGARRGFLWLVGWLVSLQLLALLGTWLRGGRLAVVYLGFQVAAGFLIWWWSARSLLSKRVPWGRLAPGAALTATVQVVYAAGSGLVMPVYAQANVRQLGALGLVLAVATWLIGFAFILVVTTVLGRVVAEDLRVRALARLLMGRLPRRPGQELHHQQQQQRDSEDA